MHLLCASEDGKWLAAANTDCEIHVYNLHKQKVIWEKGKHDEIVAKASGVTPSVSVCVQLHCTVPVYSSCPTAMAIHPTTSNLIAVHADQQVNNA